MLRHDLHMVRDLNVARLVGEMSISFQRGLRSWLARVLESHGLMCSVWKLYIVEFNSV